MSKYSYIVLLFFLSSTGTYSQTPDSEKYIQLSGLIINAANQPVPGVSVISKKLRRGAISERTGIYSITSIPGDTVFFRALGFKRYHTIIPESFDSRHCNVDIILEIDTIQIEEITILPWKTYNEFLMEITKERPVDPIIENMNENLTSIYVAIANESSIKVSPEAGYRYVMEQNFNAMASRNQYPVNNLLNPFAWAKFINGVKHGLFKNKKYVKPVKPKVIKKIKNSTEK